MLTKLKTVDADDVASIASAASSRKERRYLPPLKDVELPGGSTIKAGTERLGRGPAYRANLPPGLQTKSGQTTQIRSYRSPQDGLGADRSPADAVAQLTAWLNATYRDGWVPRFEAPKPKTRKPRKD